MTKEEAVKEVEKAFEPAFANYIITALTEGATVSDKEPTTKNDLVVDCISRAYLLDDSKYHTVFNDDTGNFEDVVYREDIEKAPSVTPQEQKPMIEIDLYSVIKQKYIEREVLDKISAEIKALSPEPTAYDVVDGNPVKDAVWEIIGEVRQIIDKYKAESEGKE